MSKLQSMTGFASATNTSNNRQIICEMRSVNGKNLDIRLRLPAGFEAFEAEKLNRSNSIFPENLKNKHPFKLKN